MIGIYKITNKINNHCYIGQSINIEQRWQGHRSDWKKGICYPLYLAFTKYGIDNFSFEIVEECSLDLLNEKEVYWIEYFDSFYNGYNQTLGGNQSRFVTVEKAELIKQIQQCLIENILTNQEICEQFKIKQRSLTNINNGSTFNNPQLHYPLRKVINFRQTNYCIDCGTVINFSSVRCVQCTNFYKRKVERPGREKLLEEIYLLNFTKTGEKYGVSPTTIRRWCVDYNLPTLKQEIKQLYEQEFCLTKEKNKSTSKKVAMIDKNTDEILLIFDSSREAGRFLNKNNSHITEVCNGKHKTAYGYKWKYID